MSQHSINFLLMAPELFQVVLINIFLLFAICFSYYKIETKKTQSALNETNNISGSNKLITTSNNLKNINNHKAIDFNNQSDPIYRAYNITPMLQVEPIVMLIILSLGCCCMLYINNPLNYAIGLTDSIIWDNLSRLMSVLLCLSACITLGFSISSLKRFSRYEFVFILWLSIIGMLCLIKSYNFLALYLNIELQSLSFYMLAAMKSRTEASAEAGLKYFILSAFSSALLLLGIALIYGAIGSQNFADLGISLTHFTAMPHDISTNYNAMLGVGLGCVCISLLFKLAAVPFHAWVADVYEGSPTPITAFFAICSKIAVAAALIRIIELSDYTLNTLLGLVAVLSLVVGSLSAMRQVKLKRLLAFSGVANVGWLLLALITGQWDLLIIHLIVYILLSISLFSVFVLPLFRTHPSLEYRERIDQKHGLTDHGADSQTLKYINDLSQIYKTNSSLAFVITIAMFSLAGIPPLAGFYSKYLILNALTQAEQYLILSLALGTAVISAFYYIRVIKTIYFSTSTEKKQNNVQFAIHCAAPEANTNAYICVFSTLLTLLFFIRPDYICIWVSINQ
jgi:proton-translocating NADH-quinone oxidoreductase chain N